MSDQANSLPDIAEGRGGGRAPEGALRVLVVTGMSGAGKTSALKALEDMGYEAVDNMPLSLLNSLVVPVRRDFGAPDRQRPIAAGVDIRTRDFAVTPFVEQLDHLGAEGRVEVRLLFMDCDDDELRRRYAETRHRHPLALDRPVSDGIVHERGLVSPLRDRADVVLDTTGMGPGDLKRILQGHFGLASEPGLAVFVISFSYRRGLPREADLVFDVRFLANPHYDPKLRPLTGLDRPVAEHVAGEVGFAPFFDTLTGLLRPLLPRYAGEGKSYLTIAVGCTGGRHRSVVVAEKLAAWLNGQNQRVHVHHRDLDKVIG